MRIIRWTEGKCANTNKITRRGWDWESFVHCYRTPLELDPEMDPHEAKLSTPTIIPAVWRDGYNNRGAEGIDYYDILGMDIDNSLKTIVGFMENGTAIIHEEPHPDQITSEFLLERLQGAGLKGIVYETSRSKAGWQRLRGFVPLAESIKPEQLNFAIEELLKVLGLDERRGGLDLSTMRDPARIYFAPAQQHSPRQVWVSEGNYLTLSEAAFSRAIPVVKPMPITAEALEARKHLSLPERIPGDFSWVKKFGINLDTLDLEGLMRAKGIVMESHSKPYHGAQKFRCHCPWPADHGSGQDGEDAFILIKEDGWPFFQCRHSSHVDSRDLRDILDWAGAELVKEYAEAWEPSEAPLVDWSVVPGLPAPCLSVTLPGTAVPGPQEAVEAPTMVPFDLSQFSVNGALPSVDAKPTEEETASYKPTVLRDEQKYTTENPQGWALKTRKLVKSPDPNTGEMTEDWEETQIVMCNFVATITEEVQIHSGEDGVETRYRISGRTTRGMTLNPLEVISIDFADMKWLAGWGAEISKNEAWPKGKGSVTGNIREAIVERKHFLPPEKHDVYSSLGWTKIKDQHYYLHALGGIAADGNHPELEVITGRSELKGFILPDPPEEGEETIKAIRASLSIMDLGNKEIDSTTVPNVLGLYRASLPRIADYALHAHASTGKGKSTLTALIQGHWMKESKKGNLIGNWSSTSAALEYLCHVAKNCIVPIDDANGSISHIYEKMERLFRSQGNGAGRSRMNGKMEAQRSFPPRGLILSTGEDLPEGHSCRSRVMLVDTAPIVDPGGDNSFLDALQTQCAEGVFTQALACWVQWLAPQVNKIMQDWDGELIQIRKHLNTGAMNLHGRSVDQVAEMLMTGEMVLAWAMEKGAITQQEANEYRLRFQLAFATISQDQRTEQSAEDPVQKFLDILPDALAGGVCHIKSEPGYHHHGNSADNNRFGYSYHASFNDWQPNGPCIGLLRGSTVYLNKTIAFSVINEQARRSSSFFQVTPGTFWKRMAGVLKEGSDGRLGLKVGKAVAAILGANRAYLIDVQSFPAWEYWVPTERENEPPQKGFPRFEMHLPPEPAQPSPLITEEQLEDLRKLLSKNDELPF